MNDTTITPAENFEPVAAPSTPVDAAPVAVKKPRKRRKKATKRVKKADPIVSASKASAPNTSANVPTGVASIEEGAADPCVSVTQSVAPLSLLREQMLPGRRHFGVRATATQVSMSVLPTGGERFAIAFACSLGVAAVAIGIYAAWF